MGGSQLYELPVSVRGCYCLLSKEACCSSSCTENHIHVSGEGMGLLERNQAAYVDLCSLYIVGRAAIA